jgi:glycosyltransferase involved in cell wall biosynthesis
MSAKKPIRVAVTGFRGIPATWGGIEHHCESLYSRLAAKGYDITIYARRHYVKDPVDFYKGMHIKRLNSLKSKGLEAFSHTFWSVLHILKDRPDIIHFHAQGPTIFSWLPRFLTPRSRIFFTCHGLDWQRKKWSKMASAVIRMGELASVYFPHYRIAVSKTLKADYESRLGVRAHYIPNGVDIPPATDAEHIEALGLKSRGYFLFVGRIVPEKRIEDLISAYLARPHKYGLVIVGDTAGDQAYLDKLKKAAKNNPAVRFVGYQFGQALAQLFANARAFVSASELEGLPITLLEALSYGLPCIASNIAPHREVMEAVDGFMFEVKKVDALAVWLDKLEETSDNTLKTFSKRAKTVINDHYNWDRIAEAHDNLYQSCRAKR